MICPVCNKTYDGAEYSLPNGTKICGECSRQFKTVLNSNDAQKVRYSINYLYTCSKTTSNQHIRLYLQEFLENNASILDELEGKTNEPLNTDYLLDYSETQKEEYIAPAISNTFAVFAWIIWVVGIIAAIIVSTTVQYNGLLIFFEIAAASIVAGCFQMAVSYIIRYLAQIAYNTEKLLNK